MPTAGLHFLIHSPIFRGTYQNKTANLIGNAVLSYRVLPGLELRSSFGYTNIWSNEYTLTPLTSVYPELKFLPAEPLFMGTKNLIHGL